MYGQLYENQGATDDEGGSIKYMGFPSFLFELNGV